MPCYFNNEYYKISIEEKCFTNFKKSKSLGKIKNNDDLKS
jgi:hypothetical protein